MRSRTICDAKSNTDERSTSKFDRTWWRRELALNGLASGTCLAAVYLAFLMNRTATGAETTSPSEIQSNAVSALLTANQHSFFEVSGATPCP